MAAMSVPEQLRKALAPVEGLQLAVLFGSVARGTARRDSDLDVGLLIAEDRPDAWADAERAVRRAAGRVVDVIDLRTAPPQLRFEIARDGALLVEGAAGSWPDFKARAMIDWWDWAPTARMIHAAAAARARAHAHGPS